MTPRWNIFDGTGIARRAPGAPPIWSELPKPPPWRPTADRAGATPVFEATPGLNDAVNAALHLRRPLLLTGLPGSGKSTLVELIAGELELGTVLRWHITSKSSLNDGLYQYDALGRLQAIEVGGDDPTTVSARVEDYVTLGPLGTAIASVDRPRAVLVDEIDKSDLDLPSDLLNVLEEGYFDIPQLVRESGSAEVRVRGADRETYGVVAGRVAARHFPVIVFASNGERSFPPPFLRRCIRYTIPVPDAALLGRIVARHFGNPATKRERATIEAFAERLRAGDTLAIDQLLNVIHLVTGDAAPEAGTRDLVQGLLLQSLVSRQ